MQTLPPVSPRCGLYIDGQFGPSEAGDTFSVVTPSNGERWVDVAAANEVDVDRAVNSATTTFDSGIWSRVGPSERREVLLRFAQKLEDNAAELALLEAADAGRPITDALNLDLKDAVRTIRWYAEAVDKLFGKVAPSADSNLGLIVREPVGVVGAVLPWNFPAQMLCWKLGPALAAGNSVVVKPPELAPLSTLRVAELASEAGLPAGVLNVVPGLGNVAGRAIGVHSSVDAVTFTGSVAVGREFLRYSAASNLKRTVLELGGKSPQLIMPDARASLPRIAEDQAHAIFFAAGQNCTAGSRVLVPNAMREEFLELLAHQAASYVVGDSLDPTTTMGPLIEQKALDRVARFVEVARSEGATVRAGGERVRTDSGGYFYAPTVVTDVRPDAAIARDEIFGPVVTVLGFDTEAEAIRMANDTQYGLAANIWSTDLNTAVRAARSVRAGTVSVNGYSEGDISTPFGGYRLSGFGGRDNGVEAFDQYTELKTIWITLVEE